jgi:DNA-binding HxlR family transcriptional regulator
MMPIDFNGLDTAIHGPLRLGIMTALQVDGALDFSCLKKRLNVPDGSLHLHLKTLEQSNYVRSRKAIVGLRPRTTYSMTPTGRKALAVYLQTMRTLIKTLEASGNG